MIFRVEMVVDSKLVLMLEQMHGPAHRETQRRLELQIRERVLPAYLPEPAAYRLDPQIQQLRPADRRHDKLIQMIVVFHRFEEQHVKIRDLLHDILVRLGQNIGI